MKLSVIVPAHNEEGAACHTVRALSRALEKANIRNEIILVNDHSTDRTEWSVRGASKQIPTLRLVNNAGEPGFGNAVRSGLSEAKGDIIVIVMADGSDDPLDVVTFYMTLVERGVDCVFGSRFVRGGKIHDYPLLKWLLNRLANKFIQVLFGIHYNDTTNAFKMYRRAVVDELQPLLSKHFNLTVELPLKAIVRGFSYTVVPNSWTNRKTGISKLKIREMGSRYLFIILYCFIEKWLSRGDYRRKVSSHQPEGYEIANS